MVYKCSVRGCVQLNISQERVPHYAFPLKRDLRIRWLKLLGFSSDYKPTVSSKVCARHFDDRYIKVTSKLTALVKNAIPNKWKIPLESGFKLPHYKYPSLPKEVLEQHLDDFRKFRLKKQTLVAKNMIENKDTTEIDEGDQIIDFKDFCSGLPVRGGIIRNWSIFNQTDGICFYRLSRDECFNDVSFAMKILINKDMRVKIYCDDVESKNDELEWVLHQCHMQLWSQFESIMFKYQENSITKLRANPLHYLMKAYQAINEIEATIDIADAISNIKIELEQLFQNNNEENQEDYYNIIEQLDSFEHDEYDEVPETMQNNNNHINTNHHHNNNNTNIFAEPLLTLEGRMKSEPEDILEEQYELFPKCELQVGNNNDNEVLMQILCQIEASDGDNEENDVVKAEILSEYDEEMVSEQVEEVDEDESVVSEEWQHEEHSYFQDHSSSDPRTAKLPKTLESMPVFNCTLCNEAFASEMRLNSHMDKHPLKYPEKCPKCDKEFILRTKLKAHILAAHKTDTSSHICYICGKEMNTSKSLNTHLHSHDASYRKQCPHCGIMVNHYILNRHIRRVHLNIKNHSCKHCGKGFADSFSMKVHEKRHEKNAEFEQYLVDGQNLQYQCPLCKVIFKFAKILEQHLKRDTCSVGDKRKTYSYPCTHCGRKFAVRKQAIAHLKKEHLITINNEDRYCLECNTEFEDYLRHMKTHSSTYVCSKCGLRFTTDEKLEFHMENRHSENANRPFECDICLATFKSDNHLRSHKLALHSTGEKKFQCDICEAKFHFKAVLNGHLKTHTDERNFRCHLCTLTFRTLNTMKQHFLREHGSNKIYVCEDEGCEEKFRTLIELKHHRQQRHKTTMNVQKYFRNYANKDDDESD